MESEGFGGRRCMSHIFGDPFTDKVRESVIIGQDQKSRTERLTRYYLCNLGIENARLKYRRIVVRIANATYIK